MALRHNVNINVILDKLDSELNSLIQKIDIIANDAATHYDDVESVVIQNQVCLAEAISTIHEFASSWHKYCAMYDEAVDKDRDDFGLLNKISADQKRTMEMVSHLGQFVIGEDDENESMFGCIDQLTDAVNKLIDSQNQNWSKLGQFLESAKLQDLSQLNDRIDQSIGQIACREYMQSEQYKNNRIGNKSAFKNIDVDLIVKMYKSGQSVGQIAKSFGVSGPTISKRLKERGVWVDRRVAHDIIDNLPDLKVSS